DLLHRRVDDDFLSAGVGDGERLRRRRAANGSDAGDAYREAGATSGRKSSRLHHHAPTNDRNMGQFVLILTSTVKFIRRISRGPVVTAGNRHASARTAAHPATVPDRLPL